jgi:hypothetical protein
MNHYDGVLKMYAEAGMRTEEDWAKAGREILSGSESRANASHRGVQIPLFTRDQTNARSKRVIR